VLQVIADAIPLQETPGAEELDSSRLEDARLNSRRESCSPFVTERTTGR